MISTEKTTTWENLIINYTDKRIAFNVLGKTKITQRSQQPLREGTGASKVGKLIITRAI